MDSLLEVLFNVSSNSDVNEGMFVDAEESVRDAVNLMLMLSEGAANSGNVHISQSESIDRIVIDLVSSDSHSTGRMDDVEGGESDDDDSSESDNTVSGGDSDDDNGSESDNTNSIGSILDSVDYTADEDDELAIEFMLQSGRGVYGHCACVLERRVSLLRNAGFGIFLTDGAVVSNGMCLTEYDGEVITDEDFDALPENDQLYGYRIGDIFVNGLQQPVEGRGLGSFFNSAVAGRCHSFVRPVVYQNRIFFMCEVCDEYPLVGPIELYFTAGVSWWRLFRRFLQNQLHVQEEEEV